MAQGRPTTQQGIIQPIAYIINDNLRFLLHLQSGIIIELTTKKGSHEKNRDSPFFSMLCQSPVLKTEESTITGCSRSSDTSS